MARTGKKEKTLTPEEKLAQALVPEEERPYQVLDNWCWVRLSQIIQLFNGDRGVNYPSKKDYVEEGIPFINAGAIQEGQLDASAYNFITLEKYNNLRAGKVQLDDIIYCLRGSLGKTAIVDFDSKAAISSSLCILRVGSAILVKYLYYLLNSDIIKRQQNWAENGSAQPNLSAESVLYYKLPLPPLTEQQRIVDRIESFFAKLDEAKEKAQAVVDGFENRKAAILHKAFTGDLTAEWRKANNISIDHWTNKRLGDCGNWMGGGTPSMAHPEYWESGDILWITSKDMKSDLIEDTQMHTNLLGVTNSSANYSDKPSILFVMRSGILRRTLPIAVVKTPFTVNQDLKALAPNDIDIDYLFWVCESKEKQILKTCMKSGTTVESINATVLMDFVVPIAPKNEQTIIVSILVRLLKQEEQAKEAAEQVIDQIDTMKKSILARAFRGELGTNDPADESAEELLKRIL